MIYSETKYLYLTKREWLNPWINGGIIPIFLASTYKSDVRQGIKTPDENLLRNLVGSDESSFNRVINIGGKATANIKIGRIVIDGEIKGSNVQFNQKTEDGLILSFCNKFDIDIAKRMNKCCCVRIIDIDSLNKNISDQLGVQGIAKNCEYTSSLNRNHFLKGTEDQWQNEFRIFWPIKFQREVNVFPGTGIEMKLD